MNQKTLGQYLKELRKSCRYSQEYVASHLNITRQTYSHYETGRVSPPVNSLYNLAKLYGLPVENFLEPVVTYNINMDFAVKKQPANEPDKKFVHFMEYINTPENKQKYKHLNLRERLLLYYFTHIDTKDQIDILTFLKIKFQNKTDSA